MIEFPKFPRILLEGSVETIDRKLQEQHDKLKPFRYDGPVGIKGNWEVAKFTVPKQSIDALRYVRDGGRGMAPGDYHRLVRIDGKNRTTVMSDTDAEMIDFLDVMRDVEGDVLIGGLGMGLAIKALRMTGKVKNITVVEVDQNVIDLVGGHYRDIRTTIVHGDIFKWRAPKGARYDWAWYDIWDTISDDNIPEMRRLKRRYATRMKGDRQQLCWAEYECVSMARGVDARNWY